MILLSLNLTERIERFLLFLLFLFGLIVGISQRELRVEAVSKRFLVDYSQPNLTERIERPCMAWSYPQKLLQNLTERIERKPPCSVEPWPHGGLESHREN